MQHQSIKRRDFLKWSGIAGGAAMLAPSLLVGCSPQQEPLSQTSDAPDTSGYIMDAVSDGLPYGADKVCPVHVHQRRCLRRAALRCRLREGRGHHPLRGLLRES